MALKIRGTVNQTRLQVIDDNVGFAAYIRLYTGSPPAATTSAATGTLLVDHTLSDYMFNAPTTTSMSAVVPVVMLSVGSGTAGYFRVVESNSSLTILQGTCGLSGSGADMILSATAITSGQTVRLLSFVLTSGDQ